jgi:hypothetical protein
MGTNLRGSVGAGGNNDPDDVFALKSRLIELGFDFITLNRVMDADTIQAIKLFQTIKNGKNTISGDGLIDPGKDTHTWLNASNAPRWQMMPQGTPAEGFFNVELTELTDHHDFGTSWLAETIREVAATYLRTYLTPHPRAALLTINDVSLPRGGNTPDHAGHEAGLACDCRLPLNDGTTPPGTTFSTPKYDRAATRAMLIALRSHPLFTRAFFNDPVLIGEGLCAHAVKHDNHIHFEIKPPAREN